ncbi:hypothetical protein C1752_01785 [Acaryochloris thomasi RCC1774]|uniref:Uncharacterized protein n=1 Tax=Acaryochloris thomasi RCC1774 TaxID=1764569 RepID=A0A2W1JWL4_9CYAN|nr:hypothetical protein C1752_01785 [Acaryochloris thomasi RCC1774]
MLSNEYDLAIAVVKRMQAQGKKGKHKINRLELKSI